MRKLGYDASMSRWTVANHEFFRDGGYGLYVQCAWTGGFAGNAGVRAVCQSALHAARLAGQARTVYVNANPWFGAARSIAEAKLNCGYEWNGDWVRSKVTGRPIVFVDVEIPETSEGDVRSLCEALEAEGFEVVIYSAHWFWVGVLGNPQWPWLLRYKLWVAYYDNDPDWDFASHPWGPWPVEAVVIEQYTNTQTVNANGGIVQVDYDSYEDAYFDVTGDAAPDVQEEDDMFLARAIDTERIYAVGLGGKRWIDDATELMVYHRKYGDAIDYLQGELDAVPNVADVLKGSDIDWRVGQGVKIDDVMNVAQATLAQVGGTVEASTQEIAEAVANEFAERMKE